MAFKRLTEKHPTFIKFQKLETFLEDNGLTLSWDNYRGLQITDGDSKVTVYVKDLDSDQEVYSIPPGLEIKLIINT